MHTHDTTRYDTIPYEKRGDGNVTLRYVRHAMTAVTCAAAATAAAAAAIEDQSNIVRQQKALLANS